MSKVIVVTDSNSGITPDEAKMLGVEVLPMPFYAGAVLREACSRRRYQDIYAFSRGRNR